MTIADTLHAWLNHAHREQQDEYAEHVHARFHLSAASTCHRQRCLNALYVEPADNPPGTLLAPALGQHVHNLLHQAMTWQWGADYTPEVHVDFRPKLDLTGYADGLLTAQGRRRVFEYKTMRSYPFQLATTGAGRHPPDGPKFEHVLQGGLALTGLDADLLTVVYVDMESKAVAEWDYDPSSPVAARLTLGEAVAAELREISELGELLDGGRIAERYVPGFGVVESVPAAGSKGQPWQCRFCGHRGLCDMLPVASLGVRDLERHVAAHV